MRDSIAEDQAKAWVRIHRHAVNLGWQNEWNESQSTLTWLEFILRKMHDLTKQAPATAPPGGPDGAGTAP